MTNLDKKLQTISYLNNQTNWTTTATLANYLDISVRSVKYCISEINKEYPKLIISSNKGYKIDKEQARAILNVHTNSAIPRNYEERKREIIISILLEKQRPTISELSERLCISPVTLQNELSKIRTEISKYHLNVHTRNDIVSITGLSKDKRKIILDLINNEIQNSYFSLDRVQLIFTTVDLTKIEKLVTGILTENEYFLDSYSLFNYVLHIALTIELRGNRQDMKDVRSPIEQEALMELGSPHVQKIVNEIYLKLKEIYNTDYSLLDIYQASVLMMTRVVSNHVSSISYNQIESILGKDISDLLEMIVASVDDTYCVNLRNENFLIRFAFHLKNLLVRLEYHIEITNLQFSGIKNDYPLIYAISVHISNIIYKFSGYVLPEDEIAYIALHVGVLMDENKALRDKVNAIIICPNYYSLGQKISKKLSSIYSENLLISNVLTSIRNDTDLYGVDLILSTEPIDTSIPIRHYILNPFVTETDIRNIFTIVDDIKSNKIKNIIRDKIMYFFHEDLFFTDKKFKNDVEAIETMCDIMISHQYVDTSYKEEIYAHEKISPSSYGNIAIPHPLNNKAKSSVIAVSLNPEPISWGINQVNLVFMLSLKEEDRDLFSDIFEFITQILKDEHIFKKIMSIKTYDEFINSLVSFY